MTRLLVLLVAAAPSFAVAQLSFPGGNVPNGTIWGLPGVSQTVTLAGDTTVPVGSTLTILPGTVITAAATDAIQKSGGTSQVDLFLDGTLTVQEASGQDVLFTGPGTGTGSWGGFIVSPGATLTAGSTRLERMTQGLRVTAGAAGTTTLTLNNARFANTAVCLSTGGSAGTTAYTVSGSTFIGCSTGINHRYGSLSVSTSVLRDSTGDAVLATGSGTLTLDRSTIAFNAGRGVFAECGTGSVTVTNSIVSHNGSLGLQRASFGYCGANPLTLTSADNDVWGNSSTWSASVPTLNANAPASNTSNVSLGGTSLSANPLFVDRVARNLRLTSRSPARRPTGTDLGALPFTGDLSSTTALFGVLHSSVTLSGALSVAGDLTIPAGVTVTVDPGTTFTFADSDVMGSGNAVRAELVVEGTLQASGTAPSQIVLTSSATTTQWYGVRVVAGGSASFSQTRFERMFAGLEATAGGPTTTSVTLSNTTFASPGCLSTAGSAGTTAYTVSGSTFIGCSTGINHRYGSLSVSTSVLRDSTGDAVLATGSGTLTLDRSTIAFNAGRGVFAECGTGSVTVTNSIVSHNGSLGLQRASFGYCGANPLTLTSADNDVWGNSSTWSASVPTLNANAPASNTSNVSLGGTSLSANPLFVDRVARNLRLTSRSPARRPTGTDLGALPFTGDLSSTTALFGVLHSSVTLSGALSVAGDLTIPAGVTVTVDPGTTFTFADSDVMGSGNAVRAELVVEGTLQASGTAPSQIVLTSSASTTQWYGVRVVAGGSASFSQTRFERMAAGLEVTAGGPTTTTLTLSNTTFASPGCLSSFGSAGTTAYTVSGSTFIGCSTGINHRYGSLSVSTSVLRDSTGDAVLATGSGTLTLDRSTIAFNAGRGVFAECGTGSVTVTNSIVSHNGSLGLQRASFGYCGANPLTLTSAYNNIWGNSGRGVAVPPTGADVASNNLANVSLGTGSQSANPLFTNGTGAPRDLTLTSTSSSIGQGRVGAVATGAVIDQGAFPFAVGPIVTVLVLPTSPGVTAGATQVFSATAFDASNNPVATTFTWAATPAAGVITAAGSLTAACSPGVATNGISATAPNGVVGRASVTITPGIADNIALNPSAPTVKSQGQQTFAATVRDSCNNALPGAAVTWSAAPQAGTITTAGVFTAGCNRATYPNGVTATSGSISASTGVTVSAGDVVAISLAPTNPSIVAGSTQLFVATAADGCGNTVMNPALTWTTTVPGGMISGVGILTAGQTNGTFANSVTVSTPGATTAVLASTGVSVTGGSGGTVASISLSPATTSLAPGASQTFVATLRDSLGAVITGGPAVTWSVVAGGGTINNSGAFVAGTVAGTFTNTVRASAGGASATASVTINPGPVATVAVAPASATLAPAGVTTFTATARDAFSNQVSSTFTWTASSAAGAISQGGVFTAGTTIGTFSNAVTATVGSVSGSASVTIQAGALSQLTVSPALASVQAGSTAAFTVIGRDSAGNSVSVTPTWSVVNQGGTINAGGIFSAGTSAGTFANTVRAEANGLTAFASVTVSPGPLLSVTVTPSTAQVVSGATQQFTAEAKDAFNNVIPTGFTWAAQPAAGSINAGGVFSAGATAGSFPNSVTATANSINGFASITVLSGAGGGGAGGGSAGAGGGSAGGGTAGGGSAAGGTAGGGNAGGGSAGGGSAGGGSAAGGTAGGIAGGSAGGASAGGAAGGDAGGTTAGGGTAGGQSAAGGGFMAQGGGSAVGGGGGGDVSPPASGCSCSTMDAFAPLAGLALLGLRRRRRETLTR